MLLTCIGYGKPSPSISWQRNGENLTDSSLKFTVTETNVLIENIVFVKSVLLLCNVSELNSGDYTCTADNAVQEPSSENFSVTVQCKFTLTIFQFIESCPCTTALTIAFHISFIAIAPVIVQYPKDTFVTTGSTVCLACTAFGAPLPSIVFSWNGSQVPTNDSSYRVESRLIQVRGIYMVQSILHVCGFSLLTVGDYTCSVGNYVAETSITTELFLEGSGFLLVGSVCNIYHIYHDSTSKCSSGSQ